MTISSGVPFEGTHLPSDPAHQIDCMSLPPSVLGRILISSMSHVHVRCRLSGRTFSMLSHAAVSVWPRTPRSLLHIQHCRRSRTTGPVRRDLPDLSLTQIPHCWRGCASYDQHCPSCRGLGLLFTTVIANFLSPSRKECLLDRPLHKQSTAPPSVTIRTPEF